jgi:mycofactocin glycosyltransferase
VRLSARGVGALARLERSGAGDRQDADLARLLVDAGLGYPTPKRRPLREIDIVAVVPVRDTPDALDRCLARIGIPAIVVDDGSAAAAAEAIAAICRRHDARLIRRHTSGGPGAARNDGIAAADRELIALIDCDCLPDLGWIELLAAHFDDSLVAVVAPRIRAAVEPRPTAVQRYLAARSPLDLGADPGAVGPGRRIGYVPTAALLVRRAALGRGFDPTLRYGEDVDLVWRLAATGWRVRFDPTVTVAHQEPDSLNRLTRRRRLYGTSAGPLAKRHPDSVRPAQFEPGALAMVLLALGGRPSAAAALAAARGFRVTRRLRARGLPARLGLPATCGPIVGVMLALSSYTTTFASPLLVVAAADRRGRRAAVLLTLAVPTVDFVRRRPQIDPLRWTFLCLADDLAYGLGVWQGAIRSRTPEAALPAISRRR